MSARDEVLARIRTAGGKPPGAAPTDVHEESDARVDPASRFGYRVHGALDEGARIERFTARVEEYGVRLRRVAPGDAMDAIADALGRRGARRVVVPEGLPSAFMPRGFTWLADGPSSALALDELDGVDGTLSACAVAIAETGTVVLDGGADQGRRALSLVPDYHLCVVTLDQVVETVPEAMRRLEPAVRDGRPITFVSGPSATSDIELTRVSGVHGPRTLEIVLVG